MLITAREKFAHLDPGPGTNLSPLQRFVVEELVRRINGHPDIAFPIPTEYATEPTAVARVVHGKWGADCPFGCHSMSYVDFAWPWFFCLDCGGNGKWVPVKLPTEKQRTAIEELLVARPDTCNRNWFASETVADLKRENKARGVTV